MSEQTFERLFTILQFSVLRSPWGKEGAAKN